MDLSEIPSLLGPSGEPVPEVDAIKLKATWDAYEKTSRVATGLGALKEMASPEPDAKPLVFRCMMLKLVDHMGGRVPEVPPITQNGHLLEAALTVGARFPMNWPTQYGNQPLPFDLEAFIAEVQKESEASG